MQLHIILYICTILDAIAYNHNKQQRVNHENTRHFCKRKKK